MDFANILRTYYKLDFTSKKQKVSALLQPLASSNVIFSDLLVNITKNDAKEAYTDLVYYDVMRFAAAIEKYNMSKDKNDLDEAQHVLGDIKKREAEQMTIDQKDVDDLYEKILSL